MAKRYVVNVLKNEGATVVTLANAYFVAFVPPKLTMRLSQPDIDSLPFLQNQAIGGEVLTFQLEWHELGLWVSPPFRAKVLSADERPLEFELELLDHIDLSPLE
jgi:hypothetical protein